MAEDVRRRERAGLSEYEGEYEGELETGLPEPVEPGPGRIAVSTAFFSIATGLSRIAGLIREVVAAGYFGVTGPMSAFTIAFQVPNLVRNLFADSALQAAFVPVFTEELEKKGRAEAFRVASALVFVIAVVLGTLTAIFVLLAPVIMPLFAPGFDKELTDLTVRLAQILFPIVLLLGFSGLIVGILNSFDQFAVPALAPLAWNLVIILTLIFLTPAFHGTDRIYAYAIGVLLGTIVQMLLPLPWLKRTGFRLVRSFDWRDQRVTRVLKLMLPVTLALGTRQMLFLLVPMTAALLVLSDPITQVIYQRGEFDAAQSDLVSEALFFFAFSLPFAGVNLILIRTFFSLQRPWTPTLIALANLGVNAGLDALLYKPMGIGGIP